MEKRERGHAEVFKKLMAERRVRPSLTLPLWDLGGFALGLYNLRYITVGVGC